MLALDATFLGQRLDQTIQDVVESALERAIGERSAARWALYVARFLNLQSARDAGDAACMFSSSGSPSGCTKNAGSIVIFVVIFVRTSKYVRIQAGPAVCMAAGDEDWSGDKVQANPTNVTVCLQCLPELSVA